MFALPGSSILWVAASLYQPPMATVILVVGTTLGALAAFWFASHTRSPWLQTVKKQKLFKNLKQHSDFFTWLILRLAPGLPHSLINYSAGILHVPILPFVAATILGIGIKSYLYAKVIYTSLSTDEISDLFRLEIVMPLIILVVLSGLFKWIWARMKKN